MAVEALDRDVDTQYELEELTLSEGVQKRIDEISSDYLNGAIDRSQAIDSFNSLYRGNPEEFEVDGIVMAGTDIIEQLDAQ